jgi:hypothetical protein
MEKKRYGKEPVPGRITLNFVKRNLLHLHERVCYAYRSLYFRVSGGFPAFSAEDYAGKPRPPICSMPTLQKKITTRI